MFNLPDTDVEAERAMLIPARPSYWSHDAAGCCCESMPSWYGRKPTGLAPLTREWAISAMQPKPQPDGSILYTLTPPKPSGWSAGWAIAGFGFILLLGVIFTYPLWRP